jgi:hypothetical protein
MAIIIEGMKKFILSVALIGFAVAVQAADAKSCKETAADKPACCSKMATKTATKVETSCPMAESECCGANTKQTAVKKKTVKVVLLSPKAASL